MRRLVLAFLAAALVLAGCSLIPAPPPTVPPSSTPPGPTRVLVRLADEVTEVQKAAIQDRLSALPGVDEVRFVSRQEAYETFREITRERSGPVDDIRPEDLPESFAVTLSDPAASTTVVQTAQSLPGVEEATTAPTAAPS
ncbi:permease-like cell division protein FtsX [Microlunatus sp. GCM10028923]|uniref:permease-like cell division protein FtsX n=1 Tax=Microlunatus sp. GCM10028923 TaxID=3273400 RepID=UPI003619F457